MQGVGQIISAKNKQPLSQSCHKSVKRVCLFTPKKPGDRYAARVTGHPVRVLLFLCPTPCITGKDLSDPVNSPLLIYGTAGSRQGMPDKPAGHSGKKGKEQSWLTSYPGRDARARIIG